MQRKDIVIIGGGVSGLSAGIYAEQHGLHAIIIEKNPTVGGLCTGWYRKGRYLDGCIHWLTGTKEGCELHDMWENVHAFTSKDQLIDLSSFGTYEYKGIKVPFYADIVKAEKEWNDISPIDKKPTHRFFKMVKDFMSISSPINTPVSKMRFSKLMKFGFDVMKVFPSYLFSMNMSCHKFASKFKHPALRHAIKQLQPGDGNLFSMLFSYSCITNKNGAIPVGGSKAMVERMKDYFLSLGGTLRLNTSVTDVVINHKSVTKVVLDNKESLSCDYLIPACDSHFFLQNILKGQYSKPSFDKKIKNVKKYPTPSCSVIYLSIKDMPDIDYIYSFDCESFKVGTQEVKSILLRNYSYDETICSKKDATISILIDQYQADYDYWQSLYLTNPSKYYMEKNKVADNCIKRIITRFPFLKDKIKVLDVFTPHTLTRYTNTYKGAFMSFLFTKRNNMYWNNGRIKGLNNVFLASQWMASPGGLPFALSTGTWAVQRICDKEKIRYMLGRTPSLAIAKHK